MTDTVRTIWPPPTAITPNLRFRARAFRRDLGVLARRRLRAVTENERDARLAEAHRLIKLAEELYERADELVKQAEELLPPDDVPPEADA